MTVAISDGQLISRLGVAGQTAHGLEIGRHGVPVGGVVVFPVDIIVTGSAGADGSDPVSVIAIGRSTMAFIAVGDPCANFILFGLPGRSQIGVESVPGHGIREIGPEGKLHPRIVLDPVSLPHQFIGFGSGGVILPSR